MIEQRLASKVTYCVDLLKTMARQDSEIRHQDARYKELWEEALRIEANKTACFEKLLEENIRVNAELELRLCPKRPNHNIFDWSETHTDKDNFMMGFELACLADFRRPGTGAEQKHHVGPDRHQDRERAAFLKEQVYPLHSDVIDVDWDEYVAWVSHGGGDEGFTDDNSPSPSFAD